MISDKTLSQLIGLIYEAGADPAKWETFLSRAAEVFDSHVATIHFQDTASAACGFNVEVNMDAGWVNSYIQHFAAINPYMKRTDMLQEGRAFVRRQTVETAALLRTEFFNDWALPQDLFDAVAGTMVRRGSTNGFVTFFRRQSAAPCEQRDIQMLDLLMPHLVRAMRLHHRIAGLERNCDALLRALDMTDHAILLADSSGKITTMNAAAAKVVRANDGLSVSRGEIVAKHPQQGAAIRRAIRCAADCTQGRLSPVPDLIAVNRPSLRRPFLIWVVPLVRGSLADSADGLVAVFIIDPESQSGNPEHALRRLFGLTSAEARLANALLQGNDLSSAAEDFGISRNTVRSQLQSIFSKTSTSRQGELIKLLAKLGSVAADDAVDGSTLKRAV